MTREYDDDLFKKTSMTFGEHLDELRVSLFKAVVSLTIGFGIGLWLAPTIVRWIQAPLEIALKEYYSEEAIEYFNAHVPESMRDDETAKQLVLRDKLQPVEVYINPREVLRQWRPDSAPDGGKPVLDGNKPAADTSKPAAEAKQPPAATVDDDSESALDDPNADPLLAALEQPKPLEKKPAGAEVTKSDLVRILVWKPLEDDDRLKVESFNVQESFMIYIKAAFLAGALLSSPFVFYFIWSFIAAGLYPHEKRYVHVFLPFSVALFLAGAGMAFFFVFPPVLNFFFGITKSMGQGLRPRISEWLSFVLLLPLGFGVSFQLPLVMLFLERIGIFNVGVYISKWRIAVLLMAVASMVLSPGGDPYSMLMMLVPLVLLYFGGIALCKWLPSKRAATPSTI